MVIKLIGVEKFKKMLLIKGFSQRSLARAANISVPYSNQIANGLRDPGPEIAKRICKALECAFDEIFFVQGGSNCLHDGDVGVEEVNDYAESP